jgi:hypothetical protein
VQALLDGASDQHKLHVLLAINCGFYPIDIATLKRTEVDLGAGTITRRRHKTRRERFTPLVQYRLWPMTVALLRQHMAKSGPVVLLTPRGNPWARSAVGQDGTVKTCNPIKDYHDDLCRRPGLTGTFKLLRKSSATKLRANPRFTDLRSHFLGHTPGAMSDKSYARPDQGLFDEAVARAGLRAGMMLLRSSWGTWRNKKAPPGSPPGGALALSGAISVVGHQPPGLHQRGQHLGRAADPEGVALAVHLDLNVLLAQPGRPGGLAP